MALAASCPLVAPRDREVETLMPPNPNQAPGRPAERRQLPAPAKSSVAEQRLSGALTSKDPLQGSGRPGPEVALTVVTTPPDRSPSGSIQKK